MSPALLSLISLLACGDAGPGDTGTAATGDGSTWDGSTGPYTGADDGGADTTVDTQAIGDALTELAVSLPAWHAGPVLDSYRSLMAGTDETCPAWYVSDGNDYWYDACTSSSGTSFDGYALIVDYDGYEDADGTLYDGSQFYGYATITDADGARFQSRGSAGLLSATTTDGTLVAYSYMDSGFSWSGADDGWLATTVEPALSIQGAWYPDQGAGAMAIDGVVRGLSGDVSAVVFDQLLVYADSLGGCPAEAGTAMSILDAEGQWIDVLFDADPDVAGTCDGCGDAWVGSTAVGRVCADLSPLLQWQQAPW